MAVVTGCDCSMCERERGMVTVAVEVEAVAEKRERIPTGLKDIRKKVVEYLSKPEKFIDMATLRKRNNYRGDTTFVVEGMSLEAATGLELLGSGHYSDVYAIPGDDTRVLKIVKQGDSGYARFVSTIRGVNNPHFPKVFYRGTWGGKTVYILERLTPEPATLGYYANEHARDAFRNGARGDGDNPWLGVKDAVMMAACVILRDNNLLSDFHSDNLMWRGDVPVVTDPLSEGC